MVAPDEGWPGVVVLVRPGIGRDGATLTVQAGEPWDDLVASTVEQGLAGVEALSGIPGSTGATPIQNVGAYGQEVAQTITAVRVYDRREGRAHADTGRVRLRLPRQPAQAGPRPVRRPRRHLRPRSEGAVSAGRLRRAGPSSRHRGGRRHRSRTSGRRCSSCAAGRAWCSTRPIPTAAAPDPSSPTRSCPRRRRSTAARAGRPATARSSSAPPGSSSPPASAAAREGTWGRRPATASRSRPSPARPPPSCCGSPTRSSAPSATGSA